MNIFYEQAGQSPENFQLAFGPVGWFEIYGLAPKRKKNGAGRKS